MLHLSIILAACFIPQVDGIFIFLGAVPATCNMFVFPPIGYMVAKSKYGNLREDSKCGIIFDLFLAWLFIICALLIVTLVACSFILPLL